MIPMEFLALYIDQVYVISSEAHTQYLRFCVIYRKDTAGLPSKAFLYEHVLKNTVCGEVMCFVFGHEQLCTMAHLHHRHPLLS